MRQNGTETLIKKLLLISRATDDAVMAVCEAGGAHVQRKKDSSLVTAANLAAHRILVDHLASLLLNCPVVSEGGDDSETHHLGKGRFWLIDPLYGAKEVIARDGEFTVNIALIDGGRNLLEIVYVHAIDAMYCSGSRLVAFLRIKSETAPIYVVAGNANGIYRVAASKSRLNPDTQLFIDQLVTVSLVQADRSLKFYRVTEGETNICPRPAPSCDWDTAVAQAVLKGADGVVMDLQSELLWSGKKDVLNPSSIATRDLALISA